MKKWPLCTCVAILFLAAGFRPPAAPQETPAKISLGICPVYDASGEGHGEVFAGNLTNMIFKQLRGSPFEPVLLNPGGAYSPLGEEWMLEYARAARVDAVLVTTLLPSHWPRKGKAALRLESYFLNIRTGERSETLPLSTRIKKRHLERGLDYGTTARVASARKRRAQRGTSSGLGQLVVGMSSYYAPSREFEKQPLGKAAKKLAKALVANSQLHVPRLVASGTAHAVSSPAASCEVIFRVLYAGTRAASKNYYLTINDQEETLGIVDGVVKVQAASGLVVVHAAVKDAPYKRPVQRSYAANTYLDCGRRERTLVLEIGAAGEAFLRWRP
ncbi:MAG: hypothetical protein ACE5MH_11215 [Terriglobia bacterium]